MQHAFMYAAHVSVGMTVFYLFFLWRVPAFTGMFWNMYEKAGSLHHKNWHTYSNTNSRHLFNVSFVIFFFAAN